MACKKIVPRLQFGCKNLQEKTKLRRMSGISLQDLDIKERYGTNIKYRD
jgi:hypothetical protein